jgi:hypothetical protein
LFQCLDGKLSQFLELLDVKELSLFRLGYNVVQFQDESLNQWKELLDVKELILFRPGYNEGLFL